MNFNIEVSSGISLDLCISDHDGQILHFQPPEIRKSIITYKSVRPITQSGELLFYNIVDTISWDFLDDPNLTCDNKFHIFQDKISDAFLAAFPEKHLKFNVEQNNFNNWFNNDLQQMRSKLHFLSDAYKQNKSAYLKCKLNSYKREYRKSIIHAKQRNNNKLISNSKNSAKTMWQIINSKRQQSKNQINSNISANEFSNFFGSVADNILRGLTDCEEDPVTLMHQYFSKNCTFSIKKISQVNLRDAINSLKNKSTKDIYNISIPLIKCIENLIISPLCKLINICIENCCFPQCLKEALIIPVFKKGDANDVNNYRPISLLPVLSKVFERCLSQQIVAFFESNNIFYGSQYGFRSKRNTSNAVLELVDQITDAFENHQYLYTVFCDLSKAFDCVSHALLLDKLKFYGFCNDSIKLIQSYLKCRYQTVKLDNVYSQRVQVLHGVPQGSVLGPLLFIIYINDFPLCNSDSKDLLFADDTAVSVVGGNLQDLVIQAGEAESRAEHWFRSNKLSLNLAKTVHVIFGLRDLSGHGVPDLHDSTKFLGVNVDNKLTWESHIDSLSSRLCKSVFALRNLANEVDSDCLKTAYFALCHSQIAYAILVWGKAAKWHRIFALQRRAVRILGGLGYRDDCRNVFVKLGILTMPSLFIFELLKYAKKNIPAVSHVSSYNTRKKDLLRVPFVRLSKSQKNINILAPKYYNLLPTRIKCLDERSFLKEIKSFLMVNSFYSYDEFLNFKFASKSLT